MGSIQKNSYSVKETWRLTPMRHSCNFAYMIMKAAGRLVKRNFSHKWEINSEELSQELCNDVYLFFSDIENLHGYSHEDIGFCYAPNIHRGDNYNVYLRAVDNYKLEFPFDVITLSVGINLKNYCCNFVRPILMHATEQSKESHKFLMKVLRKILRNLKDGVELSNVYGIAQSFAQRENENLAGHLEPEFGFELCTNFRNESVVINSSSNVIARKDMSRDMYFSINVNLIDLKEGDIKYSLNYSDTVVVRVNEEARALTHFETGTTGFDIVNN